MPSPNPLFHRAHYNILATEIRKSLDESLNFHAKNVAEIQKSIKARRYNYYAVDALVKLALSLAKRFEAEREGYKGYKGYKFDPLKFLDACSPDPTLYPLSELWED